MAILEGIRIQNYRALKDVRLGNTGLLRIYSTLPRLIVIIGANGTGKSSLVDALGFLGDCLREGVEAACDKPHRTGFDSLKTKGSDGPIHFDISYRQQNESRPVFYSLGIDCDLSGRPYVAYERLKQHRKGQQPNEFPYTFLDIKEGRGKVWSGEATNEQEGISHTSITMSDHQMLGISALGTLAEHPRISAFRDFLSGWYLSYFVPQLARTQPMSGTDPHLDQTGENLAKYLQFVERENPTGFGEMLQRIARKIPGIQGIKPIKAPDRRLLLEFTVEGFDNPLYQQDMSDGTLKMLAYLLLMEDPNPAPLIGIEEPENGLYPLLLGKLAAEFSAYAEQPGGPQILVTTHS